MIIEDSFISSVAITQNVFPARSLRPGNFIPWCHHHGECLCTTYVHSAP